MTSLADQHLRTVRGISLLNGHIDHLYRSVISCAAAQAVEPSSTQCLHRTSNWAMTIDGADLKRAVGFHGQPEVIGKRVEGVTQAPHVFCGSCDVP